MALDPITPGAAWTVQLERESGDAYVPSTRRVLLVLDSPQFPTPAVRITKEYLPGGGSSAGAEAVGGAVRFTLSPADTRACDGHGGPWQVFVFVGNADAQYRLIPNKTESVLVIVPNQGDV